MNDEGADLIQDRELLRELLLEAWTFIVDSSLGNWPPRMREMYTKMFKALLDEHIAKRMADEIAEEIDKDILAQLEKELGCK